MSSGVLRLSRAASRAQTRQRLVDAAMHVFARDGYAGASVSAIAEQAGYTVGALYSNFATKDDVFWAAFEQHCAGELAALDTLMGAGRGPAELITAIGERFADLDDAHREWWALWAELWLYGQRHPDSGHRLADVQARARVVIARALAQDERPADDEVAGIVHALWTGFILYRLSDPGTLDADAFGRAVGWLLAGRAATPGSQL